jgi:hypothetical protein
MDGNLRAADSFFTAFSALNRLKVVTTLVDLCLKYECRPLFNVLHWRALQSVSPNMNRCIEIV